MDQACRLFKDHYENNNDMTSTVGAIFLGYNERGGDPNLKGHLEATASFRDVRPAMEKAMKTHNQPNMWGNQPMRKIVSYISKGKADGARDVIWCQTKALLASVISALEDKPLKALRTASNVANLVKMVVQWNPMQKVLTVIKKIIKWLTDKVKWWIRKLKQVQNSWAFKTVVGKMCTLGTKFQDTLGKIRTVCYMNEAMGDACKRNMYASNIGNDLKNMGAAKMKKVRADAGKGNLGSKAKSLEQKVKAGEGLLKKLAKAIKFAKAARDKVQPIVDKLNKRHSVCYIKLPSCCCGSFPSCGWRGCRGGRLPSCHMRCTANWSGSVMDIIKVVFGVIGRLFSWLLSPFAGVINSITTFIGNQITSVRQQQKTSCYSFLPCVNHGCYTCVLCVLFFVLYVASLFTNTLHVCTLSTSLLLFFFRSSNGLCPRPHSCSRRSRSSTTTWATL